jgi:2-dehydropantoate 2-reductase
VGGVPGRDRSEDAAADGAVTAPLLIVGTGAMACAVGARLARAGTAVTLAGSWREALDTIAERGLRVHEPDGTWSARVAAVPLDRLSARFALALVLVKSYQTAAVADVLARTLDRSGLAVTLQNGLGSPELLEARLGAQRVAAGIAVMGAALLAPGEVRYVPGRIVLGSSPATAAGVAGLRSLLEGAGIPTSITDDLAAAVWCKLAANCAINPITALYGLSNGQVLARADLRHQVEAAAREVGLLAAAKGIRLPRDTVESTIETARATAANRSSMLQDMERGARTEIDALCGAVVQEGRRFGIATPANADLFQRVRERERRPLTREEMA